MSKGRADDIWLHPRPAPGSNFAKGHTSFRAAESTAMNSTPAFPVAKPKRDPRIDVFRGLALMMIFVDHIPDDFLNRITLHNFGFSDAAEVFVLLAGFSAMMAYGRAFDRDGVATGLRRVAWRCGRIYVFQIALLLTTFLVVRSWTNHTHLQSAILGPLLGHPVAGLARGLTLQALPSYLDILPLYVVLLAIFPLIYLAIRRSPWLALGLSAIVWTVAAVDHDLDLPNWMDPNGWYFNPFAWQLLFTIGCVLSIAVARGDGALPRRGWTVGLCWAYLAFCFVQAAPWRQWSLPDMRLIDMAMPDKSRLNPLRIADILALFYVLMSSETVRKIAAAKWMRPLDLCGRHSLEVFSTSCLIALFARLLFRSYGIGVLTELGVNIVGIGLMCAVGWWLEQGKRSASFPAPPQRSCGVKF
jgi:hypothetical protein